MTFTPYVIQKTATGERAMDIGSRLLQDRIIMLTSDVNEVSASLIVAQMLFLEAEDPEKEILFYINSPGGAVTEGLAILDTMDYIKPDVRTIVMGQACSMGSLLAQAGTPGKRMVLPRSRTMIHQVSAGSKGTVMDMQIQLDEAVRMNEELTQIYVDRNSKGKTYEELKRDMSRDFFMSAQEAVDYGLADEIVKKR